ncbi:MAG: hypothetical protein JHD04_07210 [Nocardioides sp.]|uniref:SpoIVB peptidase S55 domain-containing protein n=2 Tax=Nocardioides kribbensis TaxID=305517 RepID=A0ABV1NUI0_9ACTN|nr:MULTISPECIES: SpoIVB peptidase S55 domain-containing protein [unclassified Nocardioides]KQQ43949.1 hypothetical protein ASF50_08895 [Nocardioides sp. Leaf307]MBJ7529294.1 hypothetical protein [Nocardioides sp.]
MTRPSTTRRGRALVASTAAAGLFLGAAAVASGPAQSAEPAEDCTPTYPQEQITADAAVTGLTVSEGTTPEAFEGSIIGVLDDGIAPGVDMIMADLTSPAIDAAGGIWSGMSGSPVYIDGQLVGAVAYGLSWGSSPIAGITPFAEMDDYLTSGTRRVDVDARAARQIAASSDVTASQAEQGFRQLRMPVGISGMTQKRIDMVRESDKKYFSEQTYAVGAVGRAAAADATEETIVAGGNLATTLSYGDVTAGAVGTATSVCGGEVVGFGHPFAFFGETTLGLNPADALYVQPDSLGAPFKVANIAPAVGTITDDRTTGITGTFATLPDTTTVASTVSFDGRERTGSSDAYVKRFLADTVFGQLLVNHDRVLDSYIPGTEAQSWTITGTDELGAPFEISSADTYVSDYDISFESVFELADLAYALSRIDGVQVDDITVDSDVDTSTDTLKVTGLQQRKGGEWTTIGRRTNLVAKAGSTLDLRAVLTAVDDTVTYAPVSVKIPSRAKRSAFLVVQGGASDYTNNYRIKSVAQAVKAYADPVRNDEVSAELYANGKGLRRSFVTQSGPYDEVVRGQRYVDIRVRR